MKNNNFKLKFNLTEPDTNKSKASLDLNFIDKEEKKETKVIVSDEYENPIIIQEVKTEKQKGLFVDLLSKFGSLNMIFDIKNRK